MRMRRKRKIGKERTIIERAKRLQRKKCGMGGHR